MESTQHITLSIMIELETVIFLLLQHVANIQKA